ncbi:MAG: acyl-CoA desaturase [Pseudomonadales bacterium]|nr:acyl-CoA desaturase [Pseudomonadales bacterium]
MTNANRPTIDYGALEADLNQIKQKHIDDLGEKDVRYIKRLRRFSRIFEAIGRGIIWFTPAPIALTLGVFFLWLHRNIESIEIGHNVLHGQYDSFENIPQFHSRNFRWKAPVDEKAWREEHNGIHHVYTNVFEQDPDLNHGFLRVNDQTPHNKWHYFQLPIYLLFVYPVILYNFNSQNLGKNDEFREKRFPLGNQGYATYKNPENESPRDLQKRHWKSVLRVWIKEYIAFPVMALITGYSFWKVFLANLIVDALNNYWIALTIQATHLTEPLQPEDAVKNKGHWYLTQLDSSVNFKGSRRMSILWGHLNYQIEHHLYPDVPSHRYPDMAIEVKDICKRHGIDYKLNPSWYRAIRNYMGVFWKYSFPGTNGSGNGGRSNEQNVAGHNGTVANGLIGGTADAKA